LHRPYRQPESETRKHYEAQSVFGHDRAPILAVTSDGSVMVH
jgi:hypothetical protein